MRIFVTGGTGFIGQNLVRTLQRRGHTLTLLVRPGQRPQWERLAWPQTDFVEGEFTQPATWSEHLGGHDVLLNAVGIIRETRHASFADVHTKAPIATFDAAKAAGIGKIIQLSALGADEGAQTAYHLSKRAADEHLQGLGVPYVILRPSFVYGPGDASMTFFGGLAALPITPVPGDGSYPSQPLHIDDLAAAVAHAVESDDCKDITVDAGGPDTLTFDAILDALARDQGRTRGALKFHVPLGLMKLSAALTDTLGGIGPINKDELSMLLRGNVARDDSFATHFALQRTPFTAGLARLPAHRRSAWFLWQNPLRWILQWTIAFIWIATGVISAFVYPETESLKLLSRVGFTGILAKISLYGTAYFEIFIGLLTAAGRWVYWMGWIQLALMFGFMGFLTLGIPELWWHPFGPLTKNIPLIGATIAMMAMTRNR